MGYVADQVKGCISRVRVYLFGKRYFIVGEGEVTERRFQALSCLRRDTAPPRFTPKSFVATCLGAILGVGIVKFWSVISIILLWLLCILLVISVAVVIVISFRRGDDCGY